MVITAQLRRHAPRGARLSAAAAALPIVSVEFLATYRSAPQRTQRRMEHHQTALNFSARTTAVLRSSIHDARPLTMTSHAVVHALEESLIPR